jgi:TolB protein
MLIKKNFFIIFFIFFCFIKCLSEDNIYLSFSAKNINENIEKKSNILLNFNIVDNNNSIAYSKIFKEIIENDLSFSKYFNIFQEDLNSFLKKKKFNNMFDFLNKKYKQMIFVLISISTNNEKKFVVDFKVFDTVSGEIILENKYINDFINYRCVAHNISDEIIYKITGEIGISKSKIVFINDSSGFKEIYIVDYDGYRLRKLSNDKTINIIPKWSPCGNKIIYTSYLNNNPDLFILDISMKKRNIISKYQGLNVTGNFLPDNEKIIITLSKGKYPNLYIINMNGNILKEVTNIPCINTSPSFSSDGRNIVFVSDRIGYPQLYIMNIITGNTRRIITNGPCDSPSWSPCGNKIVFAMNENRKKYNLYIYDLSSEKITMLTSNQGNNENPSWSPDGKFITFSSDRSGKGEIYIMYIDYEFETKKLVDISGVSYTPAWSPLLTFDKC